MQRPDEQKRLRILAGAARLFAARAYHDVRLDQVAAAAKVGKSTVYVYFESKESLYLTVVSEGFERLIGDLRRDTSSRRLEPWQRLERIVGALVEFACTYPHLFELLRRGMPPAGAARLLRLRRELAGLVEQAIRAGNRRGDMHDPHPELTGAYVLAAVRGATVHEPHVSPDLLRAHLLRVLGGGIVRAGAGAASLRPSLQGRSA